MSRLMRLVYQMYEKENIGSNPVCLSCKRTSQGKSNTHIGPLPILHIGDEYDYDEYRILIIGYVAYGWDDVLEDDSISCFSEELIARFESAFKRIFFNYKNKYMGAVRAICETIYGSLDK